MKLAVIWDFDGTLVDTRQKNFNVTRRIIEHVTGKSADQYDCLLTTKKYLAATFKAKNWQELYKKEFKFDEHNINQVGKLWTEFQLEDKTPTKLFSGLKNVFSELNHIPQGIVSQNSRKNIIKILKSYNLAEEFVSIIGYEETDLTKQKPDPSGLIKCINEIYINGCDKVLYIGDHETDTICAINANLLLPNTEIIPIAAAYGTLEDPGKWKVMPRYILHEANDLLKIVKDLEV
jgi:N-acetyl-D-muramate 6-phosphate phosphatase